MAECDAYIVGLCSANFLDLAKEAQACGALKVCIFENGKLRARAPNSSSKCFLLAPVANLAI